MRFERSAQSAADETGLSTAQSIFVALGAAAALCCLICCCAAAAAARRKKGEQGDIEAPGASAAGGAKTKPLWQRFDDPATMPKSQQGLQTYVLSAGPHPPSDPTLHLQIGTLPYMAGTTTAPREDA
jgi:hypothetical protein